MKDETTGKSVLRINWTALMAVLGTLGAGTWWVGQNVYLLGSHVAQFQQVQAEMGHQIAQLQADVADAATKQGALDNRQDDRIAGNSTRIRQLEIGQAATATSVAQIASDMKDIKSLLYEVLRKDQRP